MLTKRSKELLGWCYIALGIAVILFCGTLTPSYQKCVTERAQSAANQKTENSQQVIGGRVIDRTATFWRCEGSVADANGILITAIATALMAIFTSQLVVANRRQERMARTHERAYVIWGGLYGERRGNVTPGLPPNRNAADYGPPWRMMVHNFGRTPGFITHVRWGKCGRDEFDRKIATASLSDLLKAGALKIIEEKTIEAVTNPTVNYQPATYRHVEMGREEGPVYYGRIDYQDVFRDKHHSTFAVIHTKNATDSIGAFMVTDWS